MLWVSLCFALDSATGWKREIMIKKKKYGTPDEDNPEWTAEDFARSIKFKDLPESLQRALSSIQRKRSAPSRVARDGGEEQATASANADSLRE